MRVIVRRSYDDFVLMKDDWHKLLNDSVVATPFQTFEFQQEWWQNFGTGELLLVCVYEGEKLIGLSSMYVDESNVLRWVGDEDIVDYQDVIVSKANSDLVVAHVLDCLSSLELDEWQQAELVNIPEWSNTFSQFKKLAITKGWTVSCSVDVVCPQLDLPDSFESYLGQLSGKQRREIRRKLRRLNSEDVSTIFVTESCADTSSVQDFVALMEVSSEAKSDFLSGGMKDRFINILKVMQKVGLLQFCFLKLNNKYLATYAYFSMNDTLYLYNSGYNPSEYASLSPGWVLLAKLFEHAINTGHKRFDFMRGNEGYKYKFGGIDQQLVRIMIDRE